jgi:hypothetical protein
LNDNAIVLPLTFSSGDLENVMFCTNKRDSELRLIDFGSGTLDNNSNPQEHDVEEHHTFAGSAFYIR